MRRTLTALLLAASVLLGGSAFAGEPAYIGSKKCKKCHLKWHKSWSKTKMANVFDLLKPGERADKKKAAGLDPAKDYTTDTKCLECHTTGYGKAGGYGSGGNDKYLIGVGCEMCHGAGGDYVRDDRMSKDNDKFKSADLAQFGFISKPSEKQCVNCHNKESPFFKEFNFAERAKKGVHEHIKMKNEH